MGLQEWINYALSDLEESFEGATLDDADDIEDRLFEIASESMPVYYSDMLDCVSDDIDLVLSVPPDAVPTTSPIDLIALNIQERIEIAVQERFREWQEEQEEIELEADPEE